MITVKRVGKPDYMGRAWYTVTVDGKPYMKEGIVVKYRATSPEHAIAMHQQLGR